MTKIMVSLLTFLLCFTKYGEPDAKFLSIHSDINLAMFETILKEDDTVGFIYDDENGDYMLNQEFCSSEKSGTQAFKVQTDCTVQAGVGRRKMPADHGRLYKHEADFPSEGTGSNLIVGHRVYPSQATLRVPRIGDLAYAFTDKNETVYPQYSKIFCNDKDGDSSKALFAFNNGDIPTVVIKKNNANEYYQTMKCIVEARIGIRFISRLFTVIFSGLVEKPFTFEIRSLDSYVQAIYTADKSDAYVDVQNQTTHTVRTKFAFRANTTSGCPPKIYMEDERIKPDSLSFIYNAANLKMPVIKTDSSLSCGIAGIYPANKTEPSFTYWCDCRE